MIALAPGQSALGARRRSQCIAGLCMWLSARVMYSRAYAQSFTRAYRRGERSQLLTAYTGVRQRWRGMGAQHVWPRRRLPRASGGAAQSSQARPRCNWQVCCMSCGCWALRRPMRLRRSSPHPGAPGAPWQLRSGHSAPRWSTTSSRHCMAGAQATSRTL